MTPEEIEQIQEAIERDRQNTVYDQEKSIILAAIGRAFVEMEIATTRYSVLTNRVTVGDLKTVQAKHITMGIAMVGQDAVIQTAFTETMNTLKSAQAVVFALTRGKFLPNVPLPEVEEQINE